MKNMAGRESGRIKDANQKRILDEDSRKRRQKKALEALEQDNFHEEPHADISMNNRKVPKFQDDNKATSRKRKTRSADYFKQSTAQAPPSSYPERHFCAVCGFPSNYTCISCGARYCSVKCLGTHLDTRCLKWTV